MYDSKTPGRKWNISYFDYTSNMATAETQSDYSKYIFLNLCTVAINELLWLKNAGAQISMFFTSNK